MKKVLCFAAAAMAIFASCQKTEVVYSNDGPQEIALFAVNKTATKTPVDGGSFSSNDNMAVAAYIVEGTTPANFFGYTLFENNGTNWSGTPARYWPLTTSKINFLAVTKTGGGKDNTTVDFDETAYASKATVKLSNNNDFNQNDLMFAAGTGIHTQGVAYDVVPMVFKHALAWINFQVKTATPSYSSSTNKGCSIKVNSITLHNAAFNGTLTLENNQYSSTDENSTSAISASWASTENASLAVPKADGQTSADGVVLTSEFQKFGNGLLVIPDHYATSFTINYTLTQSDNTANTFNYTYTLPTGEGYSWEMAKKYFYNITISLSEIQISPSVTDWDASHATVNQGADLNK